MSVRILGGVLAAVCACALIAPVAAGAQTPSTGIPTTSLAHVPVTGIARNHTQFRGHYSIDRFVTRGGQTLAVGTLTGRLGHRQVNRPNVAIPAKVPGILGAAHGAAACPVLHLVLGPVNLNLLGVVVTLGGGSLANQPIVLDITAQSGSGNLLGNLLCGVSNMLNGTGATSLTSGLTSGLLNLVNTLLSNPALGNL